MRITDRGPFVEGRIIDLSRAAARQIDMIGPGIAKVRLEVISPPPNRPRPSGGETLRCADWRVLEPRQRRALQKIAAGTAIQDCRLVRRDGSSPVSGAC